MSPQLACIGEILIDFLPIDAMSKQPVSACIPVVLYLAKVSQFLARQGA